MIIKHYQIKKMLFDQPRNDKKRYKKDLETILNFLKKLGCEKSRFIFPKFQEKIWAYNSHPYVLKGDILEAIGR